MHWLSTEKWLKIRVKWFIIKVRWGKVVESGKFIYNYLGYGVGLLRLLL